MSLRSVTVSSISKLQCYMISTRLSVCRLRVRVTLGRPVWPLLRSLLRVTRPLRLFRNCLTEPQASPHSQRFVLGLVIMHECVILPSASLDQHDTGRLLVVPQLAHWG